MCIGKNKSIESLHSEGSRTRTRSKSPRPERKKSSEQSFKRPHKPSSKTKAGPAKKPHSPHTSVKQVFPVLKHAPAPKQNAKPATKQNNPSPKSNPASKSNPSPKINPAPKNNPAPKLNQPFSKPPDSPPVQPRRLYSLVDLKQIISRSKVPPIDVRNIVSSPKLKYKNRGVTTKEVYPAVVSEKNKKTYVNTESWKTKPDISKVIKDVPAPSTTSSLKRRIKLNPARSLKLKVRKQLWNWSKHTIKGNENFNKLFQENAIDVDKINIDKLDLSLINMDALPIENKFVKRTVEWLLK